MSRPPITPLMKVGQLLEHYPELEERLVALAPEFAKLRNPVLRRTVARVATIEQAARIAGVTAGSLVEALRGERDELVPASEPFAPSQDSIDPQADVPRFDLDVELEAGHHPLATVLDAVATLAPGSHLEIVASFRPEPLLERLSKQDVGVEESRAADGRRLVRIRA